ncbi:HAD family hydrolase [Rhodococcus sp. HNM0569]|uniref:HAD-IA family hydrolase n=1 Tax=Rhodococcus sp. HNM0569 TaxID=2716340 RepID=UPI00146B6C14|nr:HAD family hydrolase [Rhodococcus sp. HNM0569]
MRGRLPDDLRCVVFDVGETLVDETRLWAELARRAGVTPFTLTAVLGSLIARGEDHRQIWDILGCERPDTTVVVERDDLYPDALECLAAVRTAGLTVGIAGNQPEGAEDQLLALGFTADFLASSTRWGVAKPSVEFFERVLVSAHCPAPAVLYVGDRLDNDVLPARAVGMRTALLRRGPWGYLHSRAPEAHLADLRLDSLTQLSRLVTG